MIAFGQEFGAPYIAALDQPNRPRWSVMIPTYNCAETLRWTLESVLELAPGPDLMQIEVVDDGSTADDPETVTRRVGKGRVSFYRQPHNVGPTRNFNTCIERSRGEWVHILHGDDFVLPGFYDRLAEGLQLKTVGAAFCRYQFVDENGRGQEIAALEMGRAGILVDWTERIAQSQRVQCPAMVVKRSVYEHLGGYHLQLGHAAGWEMWKRIAVNFGVWYEPGVLAAYRVRADSDSSKLARSGRDLRDIRKSIELASLYLPQYRRQALENYALRGLRSAERQFYRGDVRAGFSQLKEAMKCSLDPKVLKYFIMKTMPNVVSLPFRKNR